MRAAPPARGKFLAPPLIAAMRDTLARGEQAMLFLNRRGYAPLTLCRELRPPDAVPELHRLAGRAPRPPRAAMPPLRPRRCRSPTLPGVRRGEQLAAVGPGVERITEEAAELFPRREGW